LSFNGFSLGFAAEGALERVGVEEASSGFLFSICASILDQQSKNKKPFSV
jgi:hypothetical protein